MTSHNDGYERAGQKEKKVSQQFEKKEIVNEKTKMNEWMNEWMNERKASRQERGEGVSKGGMK